MPRALPSFRPCGTRFGLLALVLAGPAAAQVALAPVVVTAARAPQPPAEVPFAVTALDGAALRDTPALTVDGVLRGVPGFSLFRRADSFSANPTAQGVSLRGLGPSGASRSLVLLDGLPVNDPFGGWVAWAKLPRVALAGAEVVRGGGATAWGNAALGGVVQLLTRPGGDALAVTAGAFATRSAEGVLTRRLGPGTLQVTGRAFASDGFSLVAPEDRGPVDVAAASRHRWLAATWRQPVGPHAELAVTARTFSERRGNGTAYQRNTSAEAFGAVTLTARPRPGFTWTAAAYGQDQDFASTFSAVNAGRTAETPASDQFAVPATALGLAWTGAWTGPGGSRTSAGADLRRVRGETREHFLFTGTDFARRRTAGGRQQFAGLFALHERPLAADLRATLGARLDAWREDEGHRDEIERSTGASLRSERYATRDGVEFSPSAGLVWTVAPDWRLRAAAQHAFRRPTLNELYRPFRVGNVITEANAALATERVLTGELGAEHTHGDLTLGAAVFWSDLRDAVGNVTLVQGPGSFPLFGFIPAGGTGRQRLNLDRLRVRGLELSAAWRPTPGLQLRADYLLNDATVRSAAAAPALAGRRLAQVPRHSLATGLGWRPRAGLALHARARWLDRQYEDDENRLRLGAALVLDAGVAWTVAPGAEVFLQAENLTAARVETGRSAAGLVNTANPRLLVGGWRAAW